MLSKIISSSLIVGLLLVQVGAEKSCNELQSAKETLLSNSPTDLSGDSIYSLIAEAASQYCPEDDHNGVVILNDLKQIREVSCSDARFEELSRLEHFLALQGYPALSTYFEHQRSKHIATCKLEIAKQLKGHKSGPFWINKLASEVFFTKNKNQAQHLKVTPKEFQESFAKFFIESKGIKLDLMRKLKSNILTELQDATKKCNKFEKSLGSSYKAVLLVENEAELEGFDESTQAWIKMARVCQYLNSYSDIDRTIIWDQLAIRAHVMKQLYQLHEAQLFTTLQHDSSKFQKKCNKAKGCDLEKLALLRFNIYAVKELQFGDHSLGVSGHDFDRGFLKYYHLLHEDSTIQSKKGLLEEELSGISSVCHNVWHEMKKLRKIMLQFSDVSQIENLDKLAQDWIKIFKVCEHVVIDNLSENKKVDDFVKVHQTELINKI